MIKRGRIFSKKFRKKIVELKFNYTPKNGKEEEEIYRVLMHANKMLKYRDRIIFAFWNGIFLLEYLKKSDGTGYNYALKDVKYFIQKIRLMEEKINLSLSEDSFESSSAADYTKKLINTSPDENKK